MSPARTAIVAALTSLCLAGPVSAQTPATDQPAHSYGLNETAQGAGFNTNQNIVDITGGVIAWALGIFGFVFFIFIMAGGYTWMTAGGNEEKIKRAKMIIGASISGLLLVFLAYALASTIVNSLVSATTP